MDRSKCKLCGAPLVWVVTEAGKRAPLDERVRVVLTDQGKWVAGRESHFATCPLADQARKPKT